MVLVVGLQSVIVAFSLTSETSLWFYIPCNHCIIHATGIYVMFLSPAVLFLFFSLKTNVKNCKVYKRSVKLFGSRIDPTNCQA